MNQWLKQVSKECLEGLQDVSREEACERSISSTLRRIRTQATHHWSVSCGFEGVPERRRTEVNHEVGVSSSSSSAGFRPELSSGSFSCQQRLSFDTTAPRTTRKANKQGLEQVRTTSSIPAFLLTRKSTNNLLSRKHVKLTRSMNSRTLRWTTSLQQTASAPSCRPSSAASRPAAWRLPRPPNP